MINIGKKAKVNVTWKVSPYDFSQEKVKLIQNKISSKYAISKDSVKVLPEFIMINENGKNVSISHDVINNIQNIDFQKRLFKEYLEENNIQECDLDYINKIDSEINDKINYDVYDKYRKYSIKWIKWSNFLSYGENNYFDFSTLKGLVLLNGEPANQSGKTTLAIDLLHFLLFGKTTKATTQDKIFNKHIPEATEAIVEGCLEIDGNDYIIKRRLLRPALNKRSERSKTTQKVEYYKIVGDTAEELEEFIDNQQEENNIATNKKIKEVIGNEDDFDMIICATSSNLDDLIEKKETERGRLLSRWIGLLPIEQKDAIAKEIFNTKIKRNFKSNIYSIQTLQDEIRMLEVTNATLKEENAKYLSEIDKLEKEFITLEQQKNLLLESKSIIDNNVMKLDITTLQTKIDDCIQKGKIKASEREKAILKLEELKSIDFSINEYHELQENKKDKEVELATIRFECRKNIDKMNSLSKDEYCPTCGRKFENVDNSAKIKEIDDANKILIEKGVLLSSEINTINNKIESLKNDSEKFKEKSRLEAFIPTLDVNIANLRLEYKELIQLKTEYVKNKEAIDKNNKLDIEINNIVVKIQNNQSTIATTNSFITNNRIKIENNTKNITDKIDLISEIEREQKIEKNWKIYLDMVGKNGISKMVLRKTLPVINAQIARLLNNVCDFDVLIDISERNDVTFSIVKDGVKSDLSSGSGFERTAAALAIRAVLGNISTLPRCNIFVVDEILGRVAKENYDNMRTLYEKILENFDAIIQISHLEEIKDWHPTIITVQKENNISKVLIKQNIM